MIDAHIHIEKNPYSFDYINRYVEQAQKMGIDEINLLEHTHRFKEWMPLYEPTRKKDPMAKQWIDEHTTISIQEYYDFIKQARQHTFPIKVNFGLEVCYFPQMELFIKKMLEEFPYDFVVGSIHYVFDVPYDLKDISKTMLWDKYPVNDIYKDYYERCIQCVSSNLFTQLGHPDTIKMFPEYQPDINVIPFYERLAKALVDHHVTAENNVGCHYRYGHPDIGLHEDVLQIFQTYGVHMTTSSDAHIPEHVGKNIKDIYQKTMKKSN